MADYSGAGSTEAISMNTTNQISKADQLGTILTDVANKIYEVDAEINGLVTAGIEGSAVGAMATTYTGNRNVISEFVKSFAAVQEILATSAENMSNINASAEDAANGNQ